MLEHAYRSTHVEARILEHRTGTAARGRRVTGGVGHCAAHRTGAAARGSGRSRRGGDAPQLLLHVCSCSESCPLLQLLRHPILPRLRKPLPRHDYSKQICSCTLMDGLYSNSFRRRSVYRLCSGHGRGRIRRLSPAPAPAPSYPPFLANSPKTLILCTSMVDPR